MQNIFPFQSGIKKNDRENILNQKAKVIWFTGLSGSGKTTLAIALENELIKKNFKTYILDGDNVRNGLNSNLGFSNEDRFENIRRISEVSKLFIDAGIICINCFVSPSNEIRLMAKNIIGPENYIEVFVKASIESCEKRDVKGLYAKAREGKIKDFTGISSSYETPKNPDLTIDTESDSIEICIAKILDYIIPRISIS
jgi:adenylylsulfate kinase